MPKEMVFSVEGVNCAQCAPDIERTVSKIRGVVSAQVLVGSAQLVVTYENALDFEEVVRLVGAHGYKVHPAVSGKTATVYVEGMDCIDELRVIEKKLKGLPAVLNYQVNFVQQKLDIDYDPLRTGPQEIVRAISETGMKARMARPKSGTKQWWQDNRVRLVFLSGVIILVAFLAERLWLSAGWVRILYAAAIAAGGYFPARMAMAGLRSRTMNIYTLLVVAAIGAVFLSFWFEAALLVFVYTWGAVLETFAVDRARNSLRQLMDMVPKEAIVLRDGVETSIPVAQVKVDEVVIVRPGERVPLDGLVVAGSSSVDQSAITGESIPVPKAPGDSVFAAGVNQRGALEVKVRKVFQDTTLSRIVHSVERAEVKKSSYQRFSERFGRVYTPAVFVLAVLVAALPPLFGQPFQQWFYRALVVLVVSCSCGLALSVPMAVLAAISNGAGKGILIKGGADLESAGTVDVVVFDKTGTLTVGRPSVTDIIPVKGSGATSMELLSLASSVEARSEHPLAEAILRKAREEGLRVIPAQAFEAFPGLGARGTIDGKTFYVCNRKLCEQLRIPTGKVDEVLSRLEREGKTLDLVTSETEVLGVIAVADQLRKEAADTVKALRRMGIKRVVMLTGDNEGTAKIIAGQVGVDDYRAQLLPEDKVKVILELKSKYGKVAMVGDGVNDAPAMRAADVGIAMGAAGTDIALETADLALMADDLSKVPEAFRISRRATRNIRQNIGVSLAVIALVVALALFGRLNLVPGVIANEGSALIVMANALRLLRG